MVAPGFSPASAALKGGATVEDPTIRIEHHERFRSQVLSMPAQPETFHPWRRKCSPLAPNEFPVAVDPVAGSHGTILVAWAVPNYHEPTAQIMPRQPQPPVCANPTRTLQKAQSRHHPERVIRGDIGVGTPAPTPISRESKGPPPPNHPGPDRPRESFVFQHFLRDEPRRRWDSLMANQGQA